MDPYGSPPLSQQPWRQQQQDRRFVRRPLSNPASPPLGTPQTTPGSGSEPSFPGFSAHPTNPHVRPSLQPYYSYDYAEAPGPGPSYLSAASVDDGRTRANIRSGSAAHLLSPESSFSVDDGGPPTPDPYSGGGGHRPLAPRPYEPWHARLRRRLVDKGRLPYYLMIFFLALGLVGAAAHHGFYASLHGREATSDSQKVMLRYGAALAFLSKAALASAVAIAFRQRVWLSVRQRVFSVAAIDALFAASEDMSALLNLEVLRAAKLALALALFIWLTPLVVILTSDTLTVNSDIMTDTTTGCRSVRTLNFTHEESEDWRYARKIDDLFELSVSWWNKTSDDVSSPNFFDYWSAPSGQFLQVADISAYLKRPLAREGAAAELCGVGYNCSFVVNFTAPGYRCQELANGVGSPAADLGEARNPLNTSILLPEGSFSYFADTHRGDYAEMQANVGDAGIPNFAPPYPEHLGAFRTEPILWIGYTTVADPGKPLPKNASDPAWPKAFVPKVFGCEHYFTAYRVRFNYTSGGLQTTKVLAREFLTPVINTTFNPLVGAGDGTLDNTTAWPVSGYVLPRDLGRYRLTAAYHAIGLALRSYLRGTIGAAQTDAPITKTAATQTRLVDPHTYLPVPDLMDAVQSLYEDIVLSLFSNPQFLAVAWAANPAMLSGTVSGGEDTRYPCLRERRLNVFFYHRLDLWLVYGAALLFACIGVGFGLAAVGQNGGVFRGTRFSNIVEATRGPGLDRVHAVGAADQDSVPVGDTRRVKLGYGLIPRRDGQGGEENPGPAWEGGGLIYGFGVEGEVRQTTEPQRRSHRLSQAFDRKDAPS